MLDPFMAFYCSLPFCNSFVIHGFRLRVWLAMVRIMRGLGGVVVIDAAIGAHGRGSRPAHYFTVAATLDKSLTSHCL